MKFPKEILIIVPAKKNSQRLKNKNIKKLDNKYLIEHTLNIIKRIKAQNQSILTTDSNLMHSIASKYNVQTVLRPKNLSNSNSKVEDAIEHLLKKIKYKELKYKWILLLQPTSPFRESKLIERGLKKLHNSKISSSVRSVVNTKIHPYRHWKINKYGKMESIIKNKKEPYNIPRQQLPKLFFQSGDIEVIKRKTIFKGSVSGNYVLPLIVKSYKDIDTLQDLKKIRT